MKTKLATLILFITILFTISACGYKGDTVPNTTNTANDKAGTSDTIKKDNGAPEKLIGGDKDAHACLIGAGYSWCEEKQKCLRSFEEKCEKDAKAIPPKQSYDLITEALAKESGKSVKDFSLGIRKLTLTHFMGLISGQKGTILAAKQNNDWVIVFDGVYGPNKTYKCDDVKSYGFPQDMISDCK